MKTRRNSTLRLIVIFTGIYLLFNIIILMIIIIIIITITYLVKTD